VLLPRVTEVGVAVGLDEGVGASMTNEFIEASKMLAYSSNNSTAVEQDIM